MNLNQMKYFITIVEEGTISKAAKKLFMAQPPLSYQIKQLEEEVGCQLLIRTPRKIYMTREGEIFYDKCKAMIQLEEQTKIEIASSLQNSYYLNIGIVSSVTTPLSKIIGHYETSHKNVIINLHESNTYHLLEMLFNNEINCAFIRTPFNQEGLEVIELKNEDLFLASKSKLFDRKTVLLNDLDDLPIIVYRRWKNVISSFFEENKLKFNPHIIADDARTCIDLMNNSDLATIVPESAIDFSKEDYYYYRIKIDDFSSKICLVFLKDRINNQFVEDIKKEVSHE